MKATTMLSYSGALMSDGNGGWMPVPELLTESEAIRYLRLNEIGVKNPADTLRRYRRMDLIKAGQYGKCVRYPKKEIDKFIDNMIEKNPR